jgi:hypothetical protein
VDVKDIGHSLAKYLEQIEMGEFLPKIIRAKIIKSR